MEASIPRVRHNLLANILAAIASFLLEAGWYSYFLQKWLTGIDRTWAGLQQIGLSPAIQYAVALVSAFVVATGLSCVVQATGPQTVLRGVRAGALLWLGFVVPIFATNYIFEVRPWSLFGINCGFWLISMIVMGAIVGGWRRK